MMRLSSRSLVLVSLVCLKMVEVAKSMKNRVMVFGYLIKLMIRLSSRSFRLSGEWFRISCIKDILPAVSCGPRFQTVCALQPNPRTGWTPAAVRQIRIQAWPWRSCLSHLRTNTDRTCFSPCRTSACSIWGTLLSSLGLLVCLSCPPWRAVRTSCLQGRPSWACCRAECAFPLAPGTVGGKTQTGNQGSRE